MDKNKGEVTRRESMQIAAAAGCTGLLGSVRTSPVRGENAAGFYVMTRVDGSADFSG